MKPAAPTTGTVRITAPLASRAEHRSAVDGTAWLCLQLRCADRGGIDTLSAWWPMGTGAAAALVCAATARRLRKGEVVTVHAHSLVVTAAGHIELIGVHHVEHDTHITPHHEPQERELNLA